MEFEQLPKFWQNWIERYAKGRSNGKYNRLSCYDFTKSIILKYDDGSNMFFEYAFCARNQQSNELAVFTEHCGYHIFPLSGLTLNEQE